MTKDDSEKKPKRKMNPRSLANLKPAKKGEKSRHTHNKKPKENSVRSLLKKLGFLREAGLNKRDIVAIKANLVCKSFAELMEDYKEQSLPSYVKTQIGAILSEAKEGKTATVDKLTEGAFGKDTQQVDITSNGQTIGGEKLSPDEAIAYLKTLEQEY